MHPHTREITQEDAERQGKRLADDLLRGAREIGDYIGLSEDAVYHAHRMKKLPIGKFGKELIAFKSKLERAMRGLVS